MSSDTTATVPSSQVAPNAGSATRHRCRFCAAPLALTFADLGVSPLANSYLAAEDLDRSETFYPLHAQVCTACWLVQLPEVERAEAIFSDYAYFSSYSESWLRHCERYAEMTIERFGLGETSRVVEVASNDGYLLRFFAERGVPVLGIEPAANVAAAAEAAGIPTVVRFFGCELATELKAVDARLLPSGGNSSDLSGERGADLMAANNVLAHVPDLNDFVAGFRTLLAPGGVATFEFPHLLRLVENSQFDTIYHEHFSYFSLHAAQRVFARHGLTVFDVEELPTHGGSLRLFCRHADNDALPVAPRVEALLETERQAGLLGEEPYRAFAERVCAVKRGLLRFLLDARERGETVAGYGAPAKGNTLLNYCGVGPDLLPYTVDRSPHKQGRYLPGTRIPIHSPAEIRRRRPDYLLILPWNLRDEIAGQMADVRDWGGRFVVAVPELEIFG
jgi:SAM-dependent methyltransferase